MSSAESQFVLVPPGETVIPLAQDPVTVGRGDEADVRLDDGRVSRLHASIEPAGDGYRVRDLDSTNGTYLNGRAVKARQLLASGDEVTVGDHSLYFLDLTEPGLTQAVNQARMLIERREPGDRRRADEVLAIAEREAGERSFAAVLQLAESVRLSGQGALQSVAGTLSPAFATMLGRPPSRPLPAGGKLTFLFTDIQDSTPLTDRLGDDEWMALLEVHHSIVRREAAAFGGYEVKAQGDGFMLVFGEAGRAVLASIDMQKQFAEHSRQHPDRVLLVRMGLHTGEVVREGDDFYGRNVIIATRVSATARGGEVLLTEDVRQELTGDAAATVGEGRDVLLKGFDERFRVFEVAWNP